jgi:HEAT repeat protein
MTAPNIRETQTPCPIMLGVVMLALIGVATTPTSGSGPEQEKSMKAFKDLISQDSQTRDRAVDAILDDRNSVIEKLIPLVDPANSKRFNDETRSVAAYLLGELRAVEAVPVLSKALADPPRDQDLARLSRYGMAIFEALVKIGRPAVPAMIENIKTSDDQIRRETSMDVLLHVLSGKRRLLELLTKLNENALAEQPPDRKAAERFQNARAWAADHYKEDEEPLY